MAVSVDTPLQHLAKGPFGFAAGWETLMKIATDRVWLIMEVVESDFSLPVWIIESMLNEVEN